MSFINYKNKNRVRIWEGIEGYLHHSDLATFAYLTLAKGASAATHSHPAEQWSHILEGELLFIIDGEEKVLSAGECAYIPSNIPHSATALTPCLVIDTFLPYRQDLKDLEKTQYG